MCQGDLSSVGTSLASGLTMQELECDSIKKGAHVKYKESREKEMHCLTEGILTKVRFESNDASFLRVSVYSVHRNWLQWQVI